MVTRRLGAIFFLVGTSLVLFKVTDMQARYRCVHLTDKPIRLWPNICYWWRWAVWKDKYDLSSFALSLEDAAKHPTASLVDFCLPIAFLPPPSLKLLSISAIPWRLFQPKHQLPIRFRKWTWMITLLNYQ